MSNHFLCHNSKIFFFYAMLHMFCSLTKSCYIFLIKLIFQNLFISHLFEVSTINFRNKWNVLLSNCLLTFSMCNYYVKRINVVRCDIDRTARCNSRVTFSGLNIYKKKKYCRKPLHRISLAVLKMSVHGYSNISSI